MDHFLQACGGVEPVQLHLSSPDQPGGELRTLDQPFALVGRDERADVALHYQDIAPVQAYLQMIEGKILWIDLPSLAGTTGPGRAGWLDYEPAMQLGPYTIRLGQGNSDGARSPIPDRNPFAPSSALQPGLPEVTLELLNRLPKRPPQRLDRLLTLVGNAPGCQLRLVGPSVAQVHCALLITPLGTWIVDLLGTDNDPSWQGIAVNGNRVRFARLGYGDQFQIGKFLYCIRYHSQVPVSSVPSSFPQTEDQRLGLGQPPPGVQPTELLSPILSHLARAQERMQSQLLEALRLLTMTHTCTSAEQLKLLQEVFRHLRQLTQTLHGQHVVADDLLEDSVEFADAEPLELGF
jgi:hypothetical protein